VVDPDYWQAKDLATNPPLYEATLSVSQVSHLPRVIYHDPLKDGHDPPVEGLIT
jgi:hypothetical protein